MAGFFEVAGRPLGGLRQIKATGCQVGTVGIRALPTIDENGRHTVVVAVAGIVQSTAGIDILLLL